MSQTYSIPPLYDNDSNELIYDDKIKTRLLNTYFWDNTRVRIFFYCRAKHEIFSQNKTLGHMTKTLNQIIFFSPPKSEYFFQQHWESEYFFLEKKHHGPQEYKFSVFHLNARSVRNKLSYLEDIVSESSIICLYIPISLPIVYMYFIL
jgi:hypothetical protein